MPYGYQPGAQNMGLQSGANSAFGLRSGGSAQQTYADLVRSGWKDYVAQFMPIENALIDYASDPYEVSKAMDRARGQVSDAFDAEEGVTARGLRSRQIQLSPDEQGAMTRERGLARSLADVQGANLAREQTLTRQRGILGMPTPEVNVPAALGK